MFNSGLKSFREELSGVSLLTWASQFPCTLLLELPVKNRVKILIGP